MKLHLLALLAFVPIHSAVLAAPPVKLTDFDLTDQDSKSRSYHFPKSKVTLMTVADHKGSDQLAPWIQRIYGRYEKRIDIDGIADVSMIPKPFQGMFRDAFRKKLARSVLLDWGGSVVKQFDYQKSVANIYVIDQGGRIVKRIAGPLSDAGEQELFREIDRMMLEHLPK